MKLEDLIGIPYVNRGASLEGVDCWGLVWLALGGLYGVQVPRFDVYKNADSIDAALLIQQGWHEWKRITPGLEQPGDVLAFRGPVLKLAVHVGVVIGEKKFLHCLPGRNTCIESYETGAWNKLMVRIGRWKS